MPKKILLLAKAYIKKRHSSDISPPLSRFQVLSPVLPPAPALVQVLGQETLDALAEETPLRRLGLPEDIAQAVSFLASEKASFITGQVLTSDGGFIV